MAFNPICTPFFLGVFAATAAGGCSSVDVRPRYSSSQAQPASKGMALSRAPPSIDSDRQPLVMLNSDGTVEIVVQGQDNGLYHVTLNAANMDFGSWAPLPSLSPSPTQGWVALSRQQDGNLLVFAATQRGSLAYDAQSNGRFGSGSWNGLGGVQQSAPAAAPQQDGRVLVFAKGSDDALWYAWQRANNSGFGDWNRLGGVLRSAPAAVRQQDGRLLVFSKGSDNALWHTWQVSANGGFEAPTSDPICCTSSEPLGQCLCNLPQWAKDGGRVTGQPVAAQQQDGRVLVFAEGSNAALWYIWQTSNNSGFSSWSSLGGEVATTSEEAPAVAKEQDERLLVFARYSRDKIIRYRRQSAVNSGFDTWVSLGEGTSGPPAAVAQQDGRVLVFAVGTDGYLNYQRQVTPNGDFDSQWFPVVRSPHVYVMRHGATDDGVEISAAGKAALQEAWNNVKCEDFQGATIRYLSSTAQPRGTTRYTQTAQIVQDKLLAKCPTSAVTSSPWPVADLRQFTERQANDIVAELQRTSGESRLYVLGSALLHKLTNYWGTDEDCRTAPCYLTGWSAFMSLWRATRDLGKCQIPDPVEPDTVDRQFMYNFVYDLHPSARGRPIPNCASYMRIFVDRYDPWSCLTQWNALKRATGVCSP